MVFDVDGHAVGPLRPKKTQTMISDDGFERFELVGTEATKVIVECIDTRYGPAGQVLEQRIGSEPFEVEHPPCSHHRGVEQQLHLGVHGVNHLLACLEVTEVAGQLPSETLALDERVEIDKSTDPG